MKHILQTVLFQKIEFKESTCLQPWAAQVQAAGLFLFHSNLLVQKI